MTATLTGAVDGDNDTIVLVAGATAWEAAAEANAAAVDAAGGTSSTTLVVPMVFSLTSTKVLAV